MKKWKSKKTKDYEVNEQGENGEKGRVPWPHTGPKLGGTHSLALQMNSARPIDIMQSN